MNNRGISWIASIVVTSLTATLNFLPHGSWEFGIVNIILIVASNAGIHGAPAANQGKSNNGANTATDKGNTP